jgi:NAD kinase
MERLSENKIVLVTRRTRIDELIARFNTEDQARFYVEHLGSDFSDYQLEDRQYKAAVLDAETRLARLGRVQRIDRAYLPNFLFGPKDTVVALGQDGLVANILKYLDHQPLVGVNPDPRRWEGALLPFTVPDLDRVLPSVFQGNQPIRNVTMAKVTLNTGQSLFGVNDLFIGPRTHTSARYNIQIGDRSENQSSSGVIVSTGLGSTGWLRSIVAGAAGVTSTLTGAPSAIDPKRSFSWDADYLCFSVREPWPSAASQAEIVFGTILPQSPLQLISHMPENGVIFSDGMETDFLQFNAGCRAVITIAEKKGRLALPH